MVHKIITGRVTNRARGERRTPNWLKAVYAALAAAVALILAGMVANAVAVTPATPTVSACATEDASTQNLCWIHDGRGAVLVIDHGRFEYEVSGDELIQHPGAHILNK